MKNPIKDEWQSDDGRVRLLLGDCLKILPLLKDVDAIVTDPPYGIDYSGCRASTLKWGKIEGDAAEPELQWMLNMACLVISFGANNYPQQLPHRGTWICWDKRTPNGSCDAMIGCPFELAWTNRSSGYHKIYRVLHGGALVDGKPGRRVHQTQKPIKLMSSILVDFTKKDELIADPFMGSGTTGIACIRTNRRFVGIEIDPNYFGIAKQRIIDELSRRPDQPNYSKKNIRKRLWK